MSCRSILSQLLVSTSSHRACVLFSISVLFKMLSKITMPYYRQNCCACSSWKLSMSNDLVNPWESTGRGPDQYFTYYYIVVFLSICYNKSFIVQFNKIRNRQVRFTGKGFFHRNGRTLFQKDLIKELSKKNNTIDFRRQFRRLFRDNSNTRTIAALNLRSQAYSGPESRPSHRWIYSASSSHSGRPSPKRVLYNFEQLDVGLGSLTLITPSSSSSYSTGIPLESEPSSKKSLESSECQPETQLCASRLSSSQASL